MLYGKIAGKNWYKVFTRADLDDVPSDVEWVLVPENEVGFGIFQTSNNLRLIATPDPEYFRVCDEDRK